MISISSCQDFIAKAPGKHSFIGGVEGGGAQSTEYIFS